MAAHYLLSELAYGSGADASPGATFPVGTTTVWVSALDYCGQYAYCTFTVTVTPYVPPIVLICPSNITVSATSANGAVVYYGTNVASGGCNDSAAFLRATNLTFGSDAYSGSLFPVGSNTVAVYARDSCG